MSAHSGSQDWSKLLSPICEEGTKWGAGRAGGLSTRQAREFPPGLSADRPPPPDTANSRDCFTPEINGEAKIQEQNSAYEVCG